MAGSGLSWEEGWDMRLLQAGMDAESAIQL